jgi:hypothetical protein
MDQVTVTLWGRTKTLSVAYDYYDEPIPSYMTAAIDSILQEWNIVNAALDEVKQYCQCCDSKHADVDDIYRLLKPTTLAALDEPAEHSVLLICDCPFDPEDGVAVHFVNEMYAGIGPQSKYL